MDYIYDIENEKILEDLLDEYYDLMERRDWVEDPDNDPEREDDAG